MIWAYTTYCGPGLQDGNRRRIGVSLDLVSMPLDLARYISLDLPARTWQWMRLREISDHKDRETPLRVALPDVARVALFLR